MDEEYTELPRAWLRLYTVVVFILATTGMVLVPMNGELFYGVLRMVFSYLLYHLAPRTLIGSGLIADISCAIIWLIWAFVMPLPLWTPLVKSGAMKNQNICFFLFAIHLASSIFVAALRIYDDRLLKQIKNLEIQKVQNEINHTFNIPQLNPQLNPQLSHGQLNPQLNPQPQFASQFASQPHLQPQMNPTHNPHT